MHVHNEMITTIELINIIYLLTWVLFLVCVVKVPEIHSLSKVWVSNTVLPTLFIMLYINSLDLLILHEFNVILFDQYLTLSHPTQPLGSTILFPSTMYLICLDYVYKWDSSIFFSVWFISLSIMPSRFIHIFTNGKISFLRLDNISLCVWSQFFYPRVVIFFKRNWHYQILMRIQSNKTVTHCC